MTGTYDQLPTDLPEPADDGAADHLPGRAVPSLELAATSGPPVLLSALGSGRTVIYLYPRTGVPGMPLPDGWDQIPGARGCTPEAMGFRDRFEQMRALGVAVYGVSSQDSGYQRELAERLGLPYPVLSDPALTLADALGLPTFADIGERLYTRLTLVIRGGRVEHAFYPVFPTDTHADEVLAWLQANPLT